MSRRDQATVGRRGLNRRKLMQLAGVGAGGAALAAVAPCAERAVAAPGVSTRAVAQANQASDAVFVVGFHQDPTSLDPFSNTTAAFQSVTAATIEQLVVPSADASTVEPWLATEWNWVDDVTLDFTLREGVTFTNGEPFDAEAAAYSLGLLIAAEPYSGYTGDIAGAEVVDPTTVRVMLKNPSGHTLAALARGSYMYPPAYHAEAGSEGFGAAPIGTGPYVFANWNRGSTIEFTPNADYWGEPPQLGGITFRIIPEEAARVAALQAGEVHLITNLSSTSGETIQADPALAWVTLPGSRQFSTYFDARIDSPVQDKTVRQALNLAIDKEALVQLYGGEATILEGQYLTPGIVGFNPDISAYPYDPEQAMTLLAEAGYPDGFETTFSYTINRYALDKEMGETVAAYLEGVGLRVTQQPLEYGAFRDGFYGEPGELGPVFQWALLSLPDPHFLLGRYQDGSGYQKFPDNPEWQALLEEGARATDPEERDVIYQELVALFHDDPVGIFLVVPNDLYATRATVTGFTPRQDQVLWLFDVGLSE